jgi:hypothetical protein
MPPEFSRAGQTVLGGVHSFTVAILWDALAHFNNEQFVRLPGRKEKRNLAYVRSGTIAYAIA